MADLPSGLLEACVVVGASSDNLQQLYQPQSKLNELPLLEAEVLQVHAPPFVTKETSLSDLKEPAPSFSRVQRRKSFIKKKRDRPTVGVTNGESTNRVDGGASDTEDISVPKDLDLLAIPQLCFPGGLQITNEQREDSYHFLVFTDLLGTRTHGVVVQYYRPVQFTQEGVLQNGYRPSSKSRLYTAVALCLISKYPYYNALRDCLSCLLAQVKPGRPMDFEETVKEFSAKLDLVPIPPPGQLHVAFSLRPLQVFLPSREDPDKVVVDLDTHLVFLCFRPEQLLQVLSSLLMEQRVVLLSSDWSRLTLFGESILLFLRPLTWQHPYVPVLSRGMLDFLMAPTALLMGCHLAHFSQVAVETDDLIMVNIDDGSVTTSWSEHFDLPELPLSAQDFFTSRVESLQLHYDLERCHLGANTDVNEQRCQRRGWQRQLNSQILNITLELLVNIFRDVQEHLNYEHRVFNSEEFLCSREPADQPFYRKVLDTHIFHSFLKDRLNRKVDSFTRMELHTRPAAYRLRAMTESPRRPTMQEMVWQWSGPESRLSRRLGASLPNLEAQLERPLRASFKNITPDCGLKVAQKPIKTFRLPEFPPPLAYQYVQNYNSEMIVLLGKAIDVTPPEDSSLLARYHYLRGLVNRVAGRRLEALEDFQKLYKTDTDIFPSTLVHSLLQSLGNAERSQAERRPDLKRLISRLKKEQEKECHGNEEDVGVKRFQLPKNPMQHEEFVRSIQESGIVKDNGTIERLFDALTVGQQKQVDPELFRVFYTFWKETELEAQDVSLPPAVLERLEPSECVFKLSSSVKTSRGVGKIAMTQRRLFLLTQGRPGYVEVAKFRDIEEVKISSAAFLLIRIPSLKIRLVSSSGKREAFEANLKSETDLWNLIVKEMWAGRKMADQHKDPQFMQQALTNALLMDAVVGCLVGCLNSQKAVIAASKMAHFHHMQTEVPQMVPKTTSETLKHKINPSVDLTAPQAVDVLLYTPGQLGSEVGGNPKLWVALSDGKVVVFDATSWSMQQTCLQLGSARLNCMLGLDREQVWIGSQDSVIYIISAVSMSCNRQLTEHRSEVTGLALGVRSEKYSPKVAYSCSAEGTVIIWDIATLQVKKQFCVSCDRLLSVQEYNRALWCCEYTCANDCVLEVMKSGVVMRKVCLPEQQRGSAVAFSALLLLPTLEVCELWTVCEDSADVCVWNLKDTTKPTHRIHLQDCAGLTCIIPVKNQVWVGGRGGFSSMSQGKIYVMDAERHLVEKELLAHCDSVQSLCSAEDRYVLSGSARLDGKVNIWKVE
ncbi:DENN domain-containing protein 3 [Aplochiton taeniatus]